MSFFKKIFGVDQTISNQNYSNRPSLDQESINQKITHSALPKLKNGETGKERTESLHSMGREILQVGAKWTNVNWKQFPLMHNASIIRKTRFEGGQIEESVDVWSYFFTLWEKKEGFFFSFQASDKQIGEVKRALKDLKEFSALFPPLCLEPLKSSDLTVYAETFRKALYEKLKKNGKTYLPLGYRHGISNEGHTIPFKVVLEDKGETVTFYPLNLGDGSEVHPLLGFTTTQEKLSFRYFPIKVPIKTFLAETGLAAFCHLMRYQSDPPDPQHFNYQGADIYDIFQALGSVVPTLGEHPAAFEAKSQRSGTCSEKGVKNVAHDVFIEERVPTDEIKKIFLNLYFCSLITAYHSYKAHQTEQHRFLLRNAMEEFSVALEKLKGKISREEYIGGVSAMMEIKQATKAPPRQYAVPDLLKTEKRISSFPEFFPNVEEERIKEVSNLTMLQQKEKKSVGLQIPQFEIANFSQNLDQWISILEDLPAKEAFQFLLLCVKVLPIPLWIDETVKNDNSLENDVWDAVPPKEVKSLLQKLERVVQLGLDGTISWLEASRSDVFFLDRILVIYTFYAIADKLARRCEWTKLEGYASPFVPFLHKFNPPDFISIPLGKEHHCYAKISQYFAKSKEAAKGEVIFPIEPIISVEQYTHDSTHYGPRSQGKSHILFLRKHVYGKYKVASNAKLSPIYLYVWENMKTELPAEINSLYYFVFLSSIPFYSDGELFFPKSLTFHQGFDDFGKKALVIDTGGKKILSAHPSQIKNNKKHSRIHKRAFEEMGIESDHTALKLFTPYFESKTTNDALCARLTEKESDYLKMTEPVFRDLLRITRKSNLKVPLALEWVSENLIYLGHQGIQHLVDHCFFSPTSDLYVRLKEEPGFIKSLRGMVKKGLDYYRSNSHHLSAFLFLIRMGICFETHYSALYGPEKSEEALSFYKQSLETLLMKNVLVEEQQSEVRVHWIFNETQRTGKSEHEIIALLKHLFHYNELNLWKISYKWLKKKVSHFINEQIFTLQKKLQEDLSFRTNVCNSLLEEILSADQFSSLKDLVWIGTFPTFTFAEYTINFLEMSIQHKEKGTFIKLSGWEEGQDRDMKKLFEEHGGKERKFWGNGSFFESIDGKLRVAYTEKGFACNREIVINGEKRWAKVHKFTVQTIDAVNMDFLNYTELVPHTHYVFLNKRKGDPDVVVFNYLSDSPDFCIKYTNRGCQITRLDELGNLLPIRLANLSELKEKDHPLYHFTVRFSHPSRVLCFINTQTEKVEELNFFYLKLQFKRNDQGLESVQFPGYFLQVEETLEELNHFPPLFILKNSYAEKKVIVPAVYLKSSSEDFSNVVEYTKDYFSYQSKHYFLFDIDPFNGMLLSSQRAANLYIALLLKMQRDELKALKYLKKVKSDSFFELEDITLFEKFMLLKDRSPASLAFNAKLTFLFFDNASLLIEEQFTSQKVQNEKLLEMGRQAYIDYLNVISKEDISAVPKELRLTYEEERTILYLLNLQESAEQKKSQKVSKLLVLRYELLCQGSDTVTTSIIPKEVPLYPSAYEKLYPLEKMSVLSLDEDREKFPYGEMRAKEAQPWEDTTLLPFPNRISGLALYIHFPAFYERARRCQTGIRDPFDYTLLACLKTQSHSNACHADLLASLLFYVRHFSFLFKDLSFHGVKEGKEQIQVFNKIVETVVNLGHSEKHCRHIENVIKQKGTFPFEKDFELTIAPQKPKERITLFPSKIEEEKRVKTPFLSFGKRLFTHQSKKETLSPTAPFLDPALSPSADTLEGDLIDKFKQGYEGLKTKEVLVYTFQLENIKNVHDSLRVEKQNIHMQLVTLRKALIYRMNTPYKVRSGKLTSEEALFEEVEFRNKRQSLQTLKLLPEAVMKEGILKNNPGFLKKHCPLLTTKEIQQLLDDVCDYYHQLVLYQLCDESLNILDQLAKNPSNSLLQAELAWRLHYEFLDHRVYPEISYFKVTEGKLPRKEQADIYQWVSEGIAKNENRLFQHKAGGGKTDYLTPLFMLKARKEKLMPVFFTTQMMYAVDRENLSATLHKLNDQLCYLEVGLHMKLSASNLKFIYQQLVQTYQLGRGLIMTAQTYYALRLQYFFAGLKEESEEKVEYLSLILDFFETRCLQIGDEAHRNYDPLTRAIFGTEDYAYHSKEENALFIELLKPLLGFEKVFCENGITVSALSRLEKNLLGIPSDNEIKMIQKALAIHMSRSSLLNIPENAQGECIAYWISKDVSQPSFLRNLGKTDRKRAGLIALTGYFILDLLSQLSKLRTELDHSRSIFQEEEFDTPCHHKTPSTAQYEDSYLTSAASIKGTSHRGLAEGQIRKLLLKMIEEDWKEQKQIGTSETKSASRFAKWLEKSSFSNWKLMDISLSNPSQMEALTRVLAKHPLVVEYYLAEFILPQVGYSLEQLTCTPLHLLHGFKRSILFTATPLDKKINPRAIKEFRYDSLFESEVALEFCKEKNQKKVFVHSPESFFEEVKEHHSSLFEGTQVCIDPAGFFCDSPNEEVAKRWLLLSSLDGVLYFKEGRSLKVDKDEKICLLLKSNLEKPIELEGSNLKEALKAHGLNWDQLKLGTYFDASHTESANILQKVGTTAFVFVADRLTASRLIQGLMRLRGLLDEKMAQNLVWVYPKEVATKIPVGSSKEVDGAALFAWCIRNEAEQMKKRMILAAFQEISFAIESTCFKELKEHLEDPRQQIAVMKKYAKGLLEHAQHDPYGTYGDHEREENAASVLTGYAKQLYEKFNYPIPFEQNTSLVKEINQIISETEMRIKTITTSWTKQLSLEVERHTHLKKETEQMNYRPRPFDPISAEGIYGDVGIDTPRYPNLIPMRSMRTVFKNSLLTENFFIEINQLRTALNEGKSMEEKFLKPVDFLTIIIPEKGKPPIAIAICNEIFSTNLDTLLKGSHDPKVQHTVFVVTSSGILLQKGHGVLAPSQKEVEEILDSQWMKDLIIDVALLRGRIVDPIRLKERITNWEEFEKFWNRIVDAQPNPEIINKNAIKLLIKKD